MVQMAYFIYANSIGVSWALPDIVASFDFLLISPKAAIVVLTSPPPYQNFKEPKVSRGLRSFIKTYKPRKGLTITKDP